MEGIDTNGKSAADRSIRRYIADQLLPTFKERYETVLVDLNDTNYRGEKVEGVVLDRTAFYPGGGGQPADSGALVDTSGAWTFRRTAAPTSPTPARSDTSA